MATGDAPFELEDLEALALPDAVEIALKKGLKEYFLLRLMRKTLVRDPSERLSTAKLAHHRFFEVGRCWCHAVLVTS